MGVDSHKWRIYALCLCLIPLLGMMGWLTWRLELRECATAENEQRALLASWTQLGVRELDAFGSNFLAEEQLRWNDLHDLMEEEPADEVRQNKLLRDMILTTLSEGKSSCVKGYLMVMPEGRIESLASDPSWLAEVRANAHLGKDLMAQMADRKSEPEAERSFSVFWQGRDLYALRKASLQQGHYLEGLVFDWAELKNALLQKVAPTLPQSDVVPPWQDQGQTTDIRIKSEVLPVIFVPGEELAVGSKPSLSLLHQSLIVAWVVLLCSVAGLVVLVVALMRVERKQADFVSTVTHELRTPLTTLTLHAEMLEDGLVPEEKKKGYYASMLNECQRLEHLIENVLSYARLQRGGARPMRDSVTGEELFDPIADRMKERLEAAHVSFSYTISHPARLRLVHTDATAVEQIISNLTTNALKYATDVPHPEVQLQVVLDMHYLLVRVRDNGPGIPPKQKRHLFQPFRRLPNATGSHKPGIGLGLAYSRDLARSLGGNLKLETSSRGGASFLLTLPLM